MPPLSILIWLPLGCGVLGALSSIAVRNVRGQPGAPDGGRDAGDRSGAGRAPAPAAEDSGRRAWSVPGIVTLAGSLASLGLAIGYLIDYTPARSPIGSHGLAHVTDLVWISE